MPRRSRQKSNNTKKGIAIKSNPKLWESIKKKWISGSKGGPAGKISARKMQLAVKEYKKRGGKYKSAKPKSKTSLHKWTKEDWGYVSTKLGKSRRGRYLPAVVRKSLTKKEKSIENRRKGTKRGKWIPYSKSVTKKMHKYKII